MGPGIPPACSMRTAASLIGKGNAVQQLLKPPPLRQLAHYVVKRPLTIEHDIAGRQRRTPIWQAIRNRLQQKIKAMRLLTPGGRRFKFCLHNRKKHRNPMDCGAFSASCSLSSICGGAFPGGGKFSLQPLFSGTASGCPRRSHPSICQAHALAIC